MHRRLGLDVECIPVTGAIDDVFLFFYLGPASLDEMTERNSSDIAALMELWV